jgi:hypothetical protein
MTTEQRDYGNGSSANGMEMGSSSQVSGQSDSLLSNYLVVCFCSKHKKKLAPLQTEVDTFRLVVQLLSS